ncbi:response regulator [Sporichthya sp.]|uniref:response regulator n=1 Tax=Sporichthya sp. TaxID=65475 RepID=UPI0017F1B241|nr:response regulator [Sporichthya sp.]MBA3741333.1 response regulator [Sporichthya sp.]
MSQVLVVDDAPDIRLLARLLLERAGHQVAEAATAEAALDVLADGRPDVILLDLQLPGMDGWGLLADLRRRDWLRHTGVVLFSAHVDPREFRRAELEGASGYLVKPFTGPELLSIVEKAKP